MAQAKGEIVQRNQRMLIIAGVVVLLAIIVAGGYWYTKTPSGQAAAKPTLAVHVVDGDLVLGPDSAPHKVQIDLSAGLPATRDFELATRAFLRADAQAGLAQVRYHFATPLTDASNALSLRDRAVDGATAGAAVNPAVQVDGRALSAATLSALADSLEAALAR